MNLKKILANLCVAVGAILFCFLAGEICVRIFYNSISNYNMEMWRYASELKRPNSDPNLPFYHFSNKGGKYYGVGIETNSHGFRDREYPNEKEAGKKRILVLGDSMTLGWGVPLDSTFPKQLEQMLNKNENRFEVMNLGVGNYNSVMEAGLFKLKGLPLRPDLVILIYFVNDAEPTPELLKPFQYHFMKRSYLIAFFWDRYIKLKPILSKRFDWREYYRNLYSENSEALETNRRAIREIIHICSENKIRLLIVNLPELRSLKEYPFPMATEYIRSLARETKTPFLDLLPSFLEHEPKSLWVSWEDPHSNAKANSIMAQAIHKKIVGDRLIIR